VYTWIWRHLPGGTAAKSACALVLILGVSALLLFVVFPVVAPLLPVSEATAGP
jgi:hypothetical protein